MGKILVMLKNIDLIKKQFQKFYEQNFSRIIEINEKYASPKIEMSPAVKFSLVFLRFYLLFLVALLVYKFITLI